MFGKRLVDVRLEYAVEVVGQTVFKIITKHQFFSSRPALFAEPSLTVGLMPNCIAPASDTALTI